MREVLLGETALLECERCRGMWVDARTFEHICANHEAQAAVLHQWPAKKPDVAAPVKYRKCVACAKIMNRINFGRISGAVVDVCQRHGTFLDAGELHQIVDFIKQGGLDRARQRQIQELKEEEERLRALKTDHQMQRHTMGRPVEISFETHQWTGPDMMWLLDKLKDLK